MGPRPPRPGQRESRAGAGGGGAERPARKGESWEIRQRGWMPAVFPSVKRRAGGDCAGRDRPFLWRGMLRCCGAFSRTVGRAQPWPCAAQWNRAAPPGDPNKRPSTNAPQQTPLSKPAKSSRQAARRGARPGLRPNDAAAVRQAKRLCKQSRFDPVWARASAVWSGRWNTRAVIPADPVRSPVRSSQGCIKDIRAVGPGDGAAHRTGSGKVRPSIGEADATNAILLGFLPALVISHFQCARNARCWINTHMTSSRDQKIRQCSLCWWLRGKSAECGRVESGLHRVKQPPPIRQFLRVPPARNPPPFDRARD